MGKRIFLFLAINLLVVTTVTVLMAVLGIEPYLTEHGLNIPSLAVFCLLWGMIGAFISLALSRIMAKWMMGVQVVDPQTGDPELRDLVDSIYQLARNAGLSSMPEVGIYNSPEVNAFATGPTKARSLVAVSSGLLQGMTKREREGVLGHEIAHIANGDMVTMTLVQGIVNAFVMFLSRVIAFAIASALARGNRGISTLTFYITTFILQIFFMILGSMVVAWFSRYREYRADRGGAELAGRDKMVGALEALKRNIDRVDPKAQPAVQSMKISSRPKGMMMLFSTHPPLEDRIQRLQAGL